MRIREWWFLHVPPLNPIKNFIRRRYWKAYDEGFNDCLESLLLHREILRETVDRYWIDD